MENNNHSGNNFLNGFLLGALFGAAVVFFLGTKKGKKLLKAISEEGAENISNVLKKVDESVNLDGIMEDEDDDMPGEKLSIKENQVEKVKPKVKRFFRGISRRVN
ncbi:MAG: hypothetical protein Q7K54_03250 [Candidatus Parcubacteria bacterium]|nr:hypothetical protein [Candidatus Parcubacteria bacterium]